MALRGWRILSKKSKDLLGSQTPLIRKVKIQNKGDYSRFYSDTVTEKAVRLARKINPEIKIMVRTRLTAQVEELKTAGADEVIPEEFETSIEIFSRVLRDYRIPNNVIEQQVELIRLEGYSMFRGLSLNTESLQKFSTYLTATLTETYLVIQESWAREKLLGDMKFAERTGAVVIAVVRNNKPYPKPLSPYCPHT